MSESNSKALAVNVTLPLATIAEIRTLRMRLWNEAMGARGQQQVYEKRNTVQGRRNAAYCKRVADEKIKSVQALNDCLPGYPTAEADLAQFRSESAGWGGPA